MKFRALQENLRKALWERIDEGELTGLRLAHDTGFKQAHISNFLNRKRGLSVEGMDRVLNVQGLSVLDLLDPGEINKRASIVPPSQDDFENVLLVDAAVAARQASSHQPSSVLRLRPPLASAFMPLVPLASDGRNGVFSQISDPCTRYRATAMS